MEFLDQGILASPVGGVEIVGVDQTAEIVGGEGVEDIVYRRHLSPSYDPSGSGAGWRV